MDQHIFYCVQLSYWNKLHTKARCPLYDLKILKDYFCRRAKLNLWSISMTCSLWMKWSECDTIDNVNAQSMPSVMTKDAYHTAWHKIQVMSQSPLPFIQDFTEVILYGQAKRKKKEKHNKFALCTPSLNQHCN